MMVITHDLGFARPLSCHNSLRSSEETPHLAIYHAVLALLADRSSYGYELKASFETSVGPQWGELNIGHLYQILERLSRDRYVTRRHVPQSDRPDKSVYRITKKGRAELDRWLEEPHVRQGGYRDDFFLKLVAGATLGRNALARVIDAQRTAQMAELKTLRELKADHRDSPIVALLIGAAIFHTEANLKTVEAAASAAGKLVADVARPQRRASSHARAG
jgi:DNA-binding PadR family transcriptional regulator